MAGTFVGKRLSDGTLPVTQGALYTVPAATVAYVKQLFLHNENAATQTIQLWLNTSGTPRKWRQLTLLQNESADLLDDAIQLEAGDTIEGATTTATAVPYTITGVEET